MEFRKERLIEIRKELNISKAEAARRLNMSAMGYGRYESGQRIPSYQTLSYMAQIFGTTSDYLTGITNEKTPDYLIVTKDEKIYVLVESLKKADNKTIERISLFYNNLLKEKEEMQPHI